ncbi:protein NYNRIN-like [Camellia sinensis]|uniref:protein NYNRIN-like n=1 Tax=Camellia sinensis TaxID=4442 RepID=UPI001036C7B3|nr:protein NYNRIN-like [Camellia sinensis]
MEEDAKNFVRRCQSCQKFRNLIHAPAVELHNIKTLYPFHTWAFDLVGSIAQQSKGYRWILATTEVSTKWVEAIPMRKTDGARVANFIRENIICRFGIPKVMLSDNGTPFVNRHIGRLPDAYQIKHHKSSPYYLQGNRQAEATNKTLIRILSKMMDEAGVKLAVPSARMPMSAHLVLDSRKNDIKAAEEIRDRASRAMEKYHQSIACAYN